MMISTTLMVVVEMGRWWGKCGGDGCCGSRVSRRAWMLCARRWCGAFRLCHAARGQSRMKVTGLSAALCPVSRMARPKWLGLWRQT